MYLNSYMLAEFVDGIESTSLHSDPMKAELTFWAVLDAGMTLFHDCVYVAKAEVLLKLPPQQSSYTIISIGAAPQFLRDDPNCDLLCCRCSLNIHSVLSMVHDVFKRYCEWEQSLIQAFAKEKSLDELCRLSLPIFRTPVVVINENQEVMGLGVDGDKYLLPEVFHSNVSGFPLHIQDDELIIDPLSFENKTPQLFTIKDAGTAQYINVFVDDRFMARILIIHTLRDANESDLIPIVILAKYIENYLHHLRTFRNSNQEYFKNKLSSFIFTDATPNRRQIENDLTKIGWRSCDTYVCATIKSSNYDLSNRWAQYVSNALQNRIKGCVTLNREDNLFLICNLRISNYSSGDMLATLTNLSQKHNFVVGLSSEYDDFFETPAFQKQSAAALETGVKALTDRSVFYFPDFVLKYMLLNGFNSLPPIAMIPKPLKVLIDHDMANNSSYCHTLDVYYNDYLYIEMAIKELHIHRSTFKYRLERIQKLMPGIDLKDPRTRLLYKCIFEVIRAGGIVGFTLPGGTE